DKDQHVAAGANTVFRAGQVTDALTALVMLRLVDRGNLDLDAPVRRYLPEFAPKNPFQTPVTLRMLATHTAGLEHETATVMIRVLEAVTGKSYPDLMREEIFGPARMTSSSIRTAHSSGPLSYAEMQSYDAPRVPAPASDPELLPAGGLITTLRDMASLGSALLAGSRTSNTPQILSARSLRQVETIGEAGHAAGARGSPGTGGSPGVGGVAGAGSSPGAAPSYSVGFMLSD